MSDSNNINPWEPPTPSEEIKPAESSSNPWGTEEKKPVDAFDDFEDDDFDDEFDDDFEEDWEDDFLEEDNVFGGLPEKKDTPEK